MGSRNRGRGRGGGGRGRGKGSYQTRRKDQEVTQRDASYLHQFGESHPLEDEAGSEWQPKKQKFGDPDAETSKSLSMGNAHDSSSSDEEGDEPSTAYEELLSMFSKTSKKGPVAIQSDEDESDQVEEEEEEDMANDDCSEDEIDQPFSMAAPAAKESDIENEEEESAEEEESSEEDNVDQEEAEIDPECHVCCILLNFS